MLGEMRIMQTGAQYKTFVEMIGYRAPLVSYEFSFQSPV